MRRADLTLEKPWVARQTKLGRDSPWEVAAPAKYPPNSHALVGCMLSEKDARLIAAAPELLEALEELMGSQSHSCTRGHCQRCDAARTAIAKATSRDFDPVAEDEAQARMETKD